jgi:hypothetical protein
VHHGPKMANLLQAISLTAEQRRFSFTRWGAERSRRCALPCLLRQPIVFARGAAALAMEMVRSRSFASDLRTHHCAHAHDAHDCAGRQDGRTAQVFAIMRVVLINHALPSGAQPANAIPCQGLGRCSGVRGPSRQVEARIRRGGDPHQFKFKTNMIGSRAPPRCCHGARPGHPKMAVWGGFRPACSMRQRGRYGANPASEAELVSSQPSWRRLRDSPTHIDQ